MNKRKIFIIISMIVIVTLVGFSYAWFNYSRTGTSNKLIMGELYLNLNEDNDQININNVFPLTVSEARERNDNVITFSIDGKNTSNQNIFY